MTPDLFLTHLLVEALGDGGHPDDAGGLKRLDRLDERRHVLCFDCGQAGLVSVSDDRDTRFQSHMDCWDESNLKHDVPPGCANLALCGVTAALPCTMRPLELKEGGCLFKRPKNVEDWAYT